MDLVQQLLLEHTKKNTIAIVKYIDNDLGKYSELWKITSEGDPPLPQRAGWVFYTHIDDFPLLFRSIRKKAIEHLSNDIHQAVQRAICKMLYVSELDGDPGIIVTKCFDLLNDPKITVAVKMYSIRILYRIGKMEPELFPELELSLQANIEYGTAGLKNISKKILTKIKKT